MDTTSPASIEWLKNYDILLHLFDQIQTCENVTLGTLASCARVCHAWQEPASYVLWRQLPSLHPLWMLLAGRTFSPEAKWMSAFWQFIDAEDFVKDIVEHEVDRWNRFLLRASHVREIGIAACSPPELALIRSLTLHNGGKTILPSLGCLSWRHSVFTDTSILSLSSASLRDMGITVSSLGTESGMTMNSILPLRPPTVDPVFIGLADAAPFLHSLTLSGRQGPGPAVVSHLVGLKHLRELCLFNQSCVIGPGEMETILQTMENLEVLFAHVAGFSSPETKAHSSSLRDLRLQGTSPDLAGILSDFLDTPHLYSLWLKTSDETYSQESYRIFTLIASASFAPSLRTLSIELLDDPSHLVQNDSAVGSYSHALRPLLALRNLEDVYACLANGIMPFSDDDVAAIAQAWKRIQRLSLAFSPFHSHTRPPLTSLRHFAEHCPELLQLSMTKLSIPEALDVPQVPVPRATATTHPLRFLDLKMTFAWNDEADRLEKAVIARYIDHLFPNLVLNDWMVSTADARLLPTMITWERVEEEIRLLRNRKPSTDADV